MYLQNRLNAVFILAADAEGLFASKSINPGETVEIDKAHFDAVRKDNKALEALIAERKIVPTDSQGDNRDRPQLVNAAEPTPPASMGEDRDDVKVEKSTTQAEVDLSDDAPARGGRSKGR